jgi:hypothetical protein
MRRLRLCALVIVAGLGVSACGGAGLSAARQPSPGTPSIATTVAAPTPEPSVGVDWAQVQVAQARTAQLQAAEEQYGLCFSYAALDQGLTTGGPPVSAPVGESCSTAGLTPAEVQQIQGLVVEFS